MSVFVINPFVYFIPPWIYPGSSTAYFSGGLNPPATRLSTHRRFSMVSDGSDTDVGTLSPLATSNHTGAHSKQNGYYMGGRMPPSTNGTTDVKKFPFATNVNTISVLTLSAGRIDLHGCSSETSGYAVGGTNPTTPHSTVIDKFPFATNVNATNIGALVTAKRQGSSHSSPTHGYVAGGQANPPVPTSATTNIQRFPFATNTGASNGANLLGTRYNSGGSSSETHAYSFAGYWGSAPTVAIANYIEKFPFATNTNAVLSGNLTTGRMYTSGASSTTSGYSIGGQQSPSPTFAPGTQRDKFPFATNVNSTSIPALVTARSQHASVHV
jgi:hypothetical protein